MLATGSYARTLPGLEIDGQRVITSEHALQLDHVPETAIVLGGGVIGCEFASAWTLVRHRGHHRRGAAPPRPARGRGQLQAARAGLPPAQDRPQAQDPLREGRDHRLRRRASTWRAARRSRPSCCSSPSAAARSPTGLGYEEQGITVERGFVITDEYLRTSVEGVYAVGDLISINGEPHLQLAHVGFAEGILVAEHIAGVPVAPDRLRRRPAHHLLQPEVASVGLSPRLRPPRSTARTRSRPSPTTCPATAAARS